MAITIISAQLNTYGGNGQFETDQSTWGFGIFLADQKTFSRSSDQKTQGLFSCRVKVLGGNILETTFVRCKLPVPAGSVGKKFLIKANVRTPSTNPFAPDDAEISINQAAGTYHIWDPELLVLRTINDANDTWVEISGVVEIIGDPPTGYITFDIKVSDAFDHIENGYLYIDEFYAYEVEVSEDADPDCTIDLDEVATTVTDESAPAAADGSIEGEVTGGTGPFEWSLNGGAWQSSNLFAGLTSGTYTLSVREQANPDCNDSYIFSVNSGAIGFDFTIDITDETIAGASNGVAVLTPSGTGGPFTYSKDGGDTYQAGNSFADLPAGEYAFVVKDSSGNTLIKYATVESGEVLFEKAFFSRNPIPYSVNAQAGYDALTNYRIYCDTRVEDEPGSGVFISKLAQELRPNSDGKAIFNLRPAFRNEVLATVPEEPSSAITKLTDRLKWYKNFSGHLEEDDVLPVVLTPSNPFIVLFGGVSKYHFPSINYLTTYLQANKKFLTWAPTVKDVSRQQEDYLNFFVYSPTITQLKQRIKVYFDDDTNETQVGAAVNCIYGELYQIPAGTSNTSVLTINPAKNPIRYELSLLNQSDALITEVRTYQIDRIIHPLVRYLMMLNSLGAWEVHRFTGQGRVEEQFTREIVQKFLPHDYEQLDGEMAANDIQGQRNYSFSSGHIKGKYADLWHDHMRDLLRSTKVYDVTSGARLPLVITSTSMPLKEDQNYRRYVRFNAQEIYANDNYTPDEI